MMSDNMQTDEDMAPEPEETSAAKTPTRPVQVSLPEEMVAELKQVCTLNCVTQTRLVILALRALLKHLKAEKEELVRRAAATQEAAQPTEEYREPEETVIWAAEDDTEPYGHC